MGSGLGVKSNFSLTKPRRRKKCTLFLRFDQSNAALVNLVVGQSASAKSWSRNIRAVHLKGRLVSHGHRFQGEVYSAGDKNF